MNPMKAAELGSTGAPLTSTFHQLSGGNSGSGPGSVPPGTGPTPADRALPGSSHSPTARATARRLARCRGRHDRTGVRIDDLLLGPRPRGAEQPACQPQGACEPPDSREHERPPAGGLVPSVSSGDLNVSIKMTRGRESWAGSCARPSRVLARRSAEP